MAKTVKEVSSLIEQARKSGKLSEYIGDNDVFFESMRDAFAVACADVIGTVENYITDIKAISDNAVSTTPAAIAWKVKRWQEGDTLAFNVETGEIGYTVIDTTKMPVEVSSYERYSLGLVVKVATLDENDELVAMTSDQVQAIRQYVSELYSFPVGVVSYDADKLSVTATIYVDKSIISLTNGSLVNDGTVFPVVDAINTFLSSYQEQANFNDTFVLPAFEAAIMAVNGVKSIKFDVVTATDDNGLMPERDILGHVKLADVPISGYYNLDSNSVLTYTSF